MRWPLLVCIWSALAINANAQAIWANGTQRGIELLWLPPRDGALPERYVIMRAAASSNRWSIAGSVMRSTSNDSLIAHRIADAAQLDSSHRERFNEHLERMFFANPRALSRALGTYFHDTTTTPLAEYDYQIWAGSTLIATLYGVTSHQRALPKPPSWIRVRQRAQCIELWWQTDSARIFGITGYALYRARNGESPIRLIERPISIVGLEQDTLASAFVRDCTPGASGTIGYYVAALDVFGNEGRPSIVEVMRRSQAPSPPTIVRAEIGNPLALHVRGDRTTARPLLRTSDTHKWFLSEWQWRDSLLLVTVPERCADALAVTIVHGTDSLASWIGIPTIVPLFDTTTPPRPTFAELQHDGDHAHIRWCAASAADIAGYLLERQLLSDTTRHFIIGTNYVDTNTENVRYRVFAVDAHGNISEPTPQFAGSTSAIAAPELLSVTSSRSGTVLVWRVPPRTARVAVNRYDDSSATPLTIALLPGAACRYVDRTPGAQRATYQIVTLDSSGNWSRPSERRSAHTPHQHCRPPAFDSAVYRDGVVVLYWTATHQGEFLLERSSSGSEEVFVLARFNSGTQRFVDDTLEGGGQYTYRLRCIGSSDHEATSCTITIPP
ncbi:MAG: hypothetical protein KatS3mg040_1387 [Candidatus Kapaibacterium sp.]|nr:MAG: hypothetical protein KatS3mg040_1387 [Candidatus Kapabacteria bacterium]